MSVENYSVGVNNEIDGLSQAIKSLNEIAKTDGKFAKNALRRSLRAGAKYLMGLMQRIIPQDKGNTRASVGMKAKAGKNRSPGFIVGVGLKKVAVDTFYWGWANYGHRIAGGKIIGGFGSTKRLKRQTKRYKDTTTARVPGTLWTDGVKANMDVAANIITTALQKEVEDWAKEQNGRGA